LLYKDIGKPTHLYRRHRISDIGEPITIKEVKNLNCHCGPHGRHFLTSEEKIEKLEEYKQWLDSESAGVEEAIEKLKSEAS
jgi:hypothetical protein